MKHRKSWSRHQAELAEPQQDGALSGDSSEDPPSETKLKGRIGSVAPWLLTAGDEPNSAESRAYSGRCSILFVFLFMFATHSKGHQQSTVSVENLQDALLLVSNNLFKKFSLWRMLFLEDRPTNIFVALYGPSGPIF